MSRSKSSGRHGAADGLFVRGMSRHVALLGAMGRLCGCAGLRLCAFRFKFEGLNGLCGYDFLLRVAALERAGVVLAGCRLRRICACDAVSCYMKFHASGALKCRFVY